MKRTFVVVGLGTFGERTARALFASGAEVLALDRDEGIVDRVSPAVTRAVCVDATNHQAMRSVGAFDADVAVLALRKHFDSTVLVTHIMRQEGVKEIVAQVDSEIEVSAIQAVGATQAVFVERDMAERTASKLLLPDLADQVLLGSNCALIEVPVPLDRAGHTLKEMNLRHKYGVTVVGIRIPGEGGPEEVEVAPSADKPVQVGYRLIVLGTSDTLTAFREGFH